MIGNVRLWKDLGEISKTETSGYITEDSYNHAAEYVNIALFNILAPFYSVNQTVKDLLAPFIKHNAPVSTSGIGKLDKPEDYLRYIDSSIGGHPVYPISINEVSITRQSPIRKPSRLKNLYFSYQESDEIMYMPSEAMQVELTYFRQPKTPVIQLVPEEDEDSDYLVPTSLQDFEWNELAYGFIFSMMLQRYGIEMKEQLLTQFADIGLQRETINI